ncbi:MAG: BamA/TamA family outer membrane protein [Acidaminococcaceae bacterium]|nr:BamA/TamA family outer membrane protein [Acidaminococcaceae bacterium]
MEKRPSAAVAALFALFISSFTGLTAFAEEPTYSETKFVPMEQPKKKDQPVQKTEGEIFQENLETHNALLNTPTQTEVTDEGMEGYMVRNVQVAGNNIVPAGPILKKALTTGGLALNPNTLQIDAQAISAMGWFSDIQVRLVDVEGGSTGDSHAAQNPAVDVIFEVVENPVFRKLEVTGNTLVDAGAIQEELRLKPGEIANTAIINYQMEKLMGDYHQAGYTAAKVLDIALSEGGVLYLQINEGVIEEITVKGNKKTKDYVILREMRFKPGEPFNINKARRTLQRLNNLEFIAGSDMRLTPGREDPRKLAVEVQVVEDSPLILGAGVGYSESERVFGTVSVEDPNFLGTGDKARVSWEIGSKSKSNYALSYTHPWLDKKETTLDVKVYGHTHEYTEYDRGAHEVGRYDKKSNGQEITLSRAEGEYTRNYIKLKRRDDKYVKPIDGYSTQYYEDSYNERYYQEFGSYTTAAQRRKQNFGETRSITLMRITDKRDNVFFPRTGNMTTLSLEQAGFGGDFNFTKLFGEYRYYVPVKKHVVAMDVMAGYAWGDLPRSQRFSLGGSSLRGYKEDQFMGNSMLKGTVEYRVPISRKVTVLGFLDAGYAWDKRIESHFDLGKIKVGYGLGARFYTPIGPVKLDYGWGRDRGRFHFSFGYQF